MKMKKVAVIGAAGKMGSWFARYFAGRGHGVSAFDVRPFKIAGVMEAKSLAGCVEDADLVLVCVPVRRTPAVLLQCAAAMRAGSAIAEISSVKSRTHGALKKAAGHAGITALCVHPMFGPGANEKKQLKVLLIPVADREEEERLAQQVFAGMSVKVMPDAKTHDRAIAAVLGLTYFCNVAFAGAMSKEGDLALLKEVGGTTFAVQSMLAESVMTDEPELISALILDNPYARKYIAGYLKDAQGIARLSQKALEGRLEKTRSALEKQQDIQASYRRMYEMLGR